MIRVGIDVGGTHTDAVLLESQTVLSSVKTPTSTDVTSGITTALELLLEQQPGQRSQIAAVMIGTTHFTNAVVERRGLSTVAAIRIGLPASRSLRPFVDWPQDLSSIVCGLIFEIEGGHEVDGRPIVDFDENAMRAAAREIARRGIVDVAIASVFSPLNDACERRAQEILRQVHPHSHITASSELGRLGLLERENAALLNASIGHLARATIEGFKEGLRKSGIDAPLYLTQNDGTVMQAGYAERFPIFSFASGPTNSMRGAAFLSGLREAVVVDVGGTTTDFGYLKDGFPRQANNVVEVGGVRTAFRMPDLVSVGLGGGSMVDLERATVGPRSVGFRLPVSGKVFGGDELTASDIAVHAELVDLGNRQLVESLDEAQVLRVLEGIRLQLEEHVDRMKSDADDVTVIAVGGGDFLVPDNLDGVSKVVHVQHGAVANAVGAAIAQVSGEIDQVFSNMTREEALSQATSLARRRAIEAGADEASLEVVDIEDLPVAYLPGDARRVHVRVIGDVERVKSRETKVTQ